MKTAKASKAKSREDSPPRKVGRPRSPARNQQSPDWKPKTGRSRSPARKSPARKSPARKSPSRKSPVRKTPLKKSPSKKSPSRPTKDVKSNDINNIPYVFLPKKDIIKHEELFYEESHKSGEAKNGIDTSNIRPGLRERKPRFAEYYSMSRRTTRTKDHDDLLHLAQNTALPKNDFSFEDAKRDPFSDDNVPRRLITPIRDVKKEYFEFGGPVGVILLILFGGTFCLAQGFLCSKQPCTFTQYPDLSRYSEICNWLSVRAAVIVAAYLILQIALSFVPFFGKKTVLPGVNHTFVANSLFALIVLGCLTAAIEHFYMPISQIVYDDFVQLSVITFIVGNVLSLGLYFKGRRAPIERRNPFANTGNAIYDFYMGTEINPVIMGILPAKVLIFRISLCAPIMINFLWMYRDISIRNFPDLTNQTVWNIETYAQIAQSVHVNPTLLLFCALQIIFIIDSLIMESSQVSTFEFAQEGVGYLMTVGYFIYPFLLTTLTKRILEQNIRMPNYVLIPTLILFLTGYYIYRASNSQKSRFRENPLDPRVSHLETIPTMQGKRLLVSGWWGLVRHPNYLGDIMMEIAMGIGAYNAFPIILNVFIIFFLINRIKRDNDRCSERYGVAWTRYCKKVPHCLIPRVY